MAHANGTDWRIVTGVLIGAAAMSLRWGGGNRFPGEMAAGRGAIVSECDGAIEELVIQYTPAGAGIVATAYRQFLSLLPDEVTVTVVCPDRTAWRDLQGRVGTVRCRLKPVFTGHAMTCWSRDRWLALTPPWPGGRLALVTACEEAGAGVWPSRSGDARIAGDLAATRPRVAAWESALAFDGGDFVAGGDVVFVSPQVLTRNVGVTVRSESELAEKLSRLVGRRVVILPEAPRHHAGMFMMFCGNRMAVVGDPSLALAVLCRATAQSEAECAAAVSDWFPAPGPDFSRETQQQFDSVASACRAEGYRVVKIPVIPGRDGRTYVTYTNVLIDERSGGRTVYMPVYRRAEALNRAAEAAWHCMGYDVRRVDCTRVYPNFGSLHCLVNVLRRTPPAPPPTSRRGQSPFLRALGEP